MDDALVTEASPYYYRFGRLRRQGTTNVQHGLAGLPLRLLLGIGAAHVRITPVPRDSGATLLDQQLAGSDTGGWSNHVRAGLVWDTRDRETGATSGVWSELLVQRFDGALGSDHEYTRWTLADRRYLSLGTPRVVFANRLLLQAVSGEPPFYDLFVVQTSFKQQEGLGGAKTLRGIPKNRYVGKAMFLWNGELRWRASEFRLFGRPSHVVLSAFLDQGRVWADALELEELASGLHRGFGGGVRVGMGENFVVALDVGHSTEAAAPFYIGLNYLF
jgi:outer membrane protein assembly factor BamA